MGSTSDPNSEPNPASSFIAATEYLDLGPSSSLGHTPSEGDGEVIVVAEEVEVTSGEGDRSCDVSADQSEDPGSEEGKSPRHEEEKDSRSE